VRRKAESGNGRRGRGRVGLLQQGGRLQCVVGERLLGGSGWEVSGIEFVRRRLGRRFKGKHTDRWGLRDGVAGSNVL